MHACRGWLLGSAAILMPLVAGCQPISVNESGSAVGSSSYVFGYQSQVHAGDYEQVWSATLKGLQQLQINVGSALMGPRQGQIEASLPDGTAVSITVEPTRPDATTVKIRVGLVGSQFESQGIQVRISSILQTGQ